MMACWKINVFDDVPCKKEIQAFVQCAEKVVSYLVCLVRAYRLYKYL